MKKNRNVVLGVVLVVVMCADEVYGDGPAVCYEQLDYSCEGLHPDETLFPCNAAPCLAEHQLNSLGTYLIQNNYYVMKGAVGLVAGCRAWRSQIAIG
jgi:hypothetical protein